MPNTNPKEIKSLEQKIAAGRERLYEIYAARGYTDSAVLAYSIKLDRLLNRYQRMDQGSLSATKPSH
ncbi:MAG TPA: aspartyl-phosphate phosphatase Spo0E family protein [Firmicutes bacterium]|jgi:hypothetical protein|nr:aspartyl-phosphate phosphatase Spo0E family protein [Bacillota bacterium]